MDRQLAVPFPQREVDKGSANVDSHAVRVVRYGHGRVAAPQSYASLTPARGYAVRKSSLRPLNMAVKYGALPSASANNVLANPLTMRGLPTLSRRFDKPPPQNPLWTC